MPWPPGGAKHFLAGMPSLEFEYKLTGHHAGRGAWSTWHGERRRYLA